MIDHLNERPEVTRAREKAMEWAKDKPDIDHIMASEPPQETFINNIVEITIVPSATYNGRKYSFTKMLHPSYVDDDDYFEMWLEQCADTAYRALRQDIRRGLLD